MRKVLISLGISLFFIVNVYATGSQLKQLNAHIADTLSYLQNEQTKASLKFNQLTMTENDIFNFKLQSKYVKIGAGKTLSLNINRISFDSHEGAKPALYFKGKLGVNLIDSIFGDLAKEYANLLFRQLSRNFEGTLLELFEDLDLDEYLGITGFTTSISKDSEGNYIGLSALVHLNYDIARAKADNMDITDFPVVDTVLNVAIDIRTGIKMEGAVVFNPTYRNYDDYKSMFTHIIQGLIDYDEDSVNKFLRVVELVEIISNIILDEGDDIPEDIKSRWGSIMNQKFLNR